MKEEETLIDQIAKAYEEAVRRNIEANMILIDGELAISNGLAMADAYGNPIQEPAMIFGLRIRYAPPHSIPNDSSFALLKSPRKMEPTYAELLAENKKLKAENEKLHKIEELIADPDDSDLNDK